MQRKEMRKEYTRTANREHTCCECGLKIPKKLKYKDVSTDAIGIMKNFKLHLECDDLRNRLHRDLTEEVFYTGLRDRLQEIGVFKDSRCWPGYRAAWASILRKYRSGVYVPPPKMPGIRFFTNPKANKEYTCNSCQLPITVRSRYYYVAVNTKPLTIYRLHSACAQVANIVEQAAHKGDSHGQQLRFSGRP